MILSFNPIIEADENIICAGREPDDTDLAAIRAADAVILSQGCYASLYRMARDNCRHIFPNLDIRFDYPGKRNQARLFRDMGVPHPPTWIFNALAPYRACPEPIPFPAVVKLDWGGEGTNVFKVDDNRTLAAAMDHVAACEASGQPGFLIQACIPTGNRSLRVTVIGEHTTAYWRIQADPRRFGTAVTSGARLDHEADPHLQDAALKTVMAFCKRTHLQLGGFDFIFDDRSLQKGYIEPLMLEINFFFGRTGLGGSQRYYDLFERQVDAWLAGLSLKR
jgi:ribosomal protein S6--L-glutamate ligase